ncbi:carbohydrate ABC transporter permease [Devriesea agamarum]|uniref:carbohydrate ABC transporter permease n=1 Tax=Devriesea agamarum TaxID=472569 RepID=UPI00071D18E8|nr:sugar ABC transporter permease [Devriesea agamarum]
MAASNPAGAPVVKRRRSSRAARRYPLWFLLPALLLFTVFFVGPAAVGLALSLTDYSTTSTSIHWKGLDNYHLLWTVYGVDFARAIVHQFVYAIIVTIAKTAIGVGIALLLDRAFRGRDVLRAMVFLPMMFSGIVMAKVFQFLLREDGPINGALRLVGLDALTRDWLANPHTALAAVAASDTWLYIGWTVVIVLAALQSVPSELVEAAQVDGAGRWRVFTVVRLPHILPAVNIALLLTLISGLKVFDLIYAMTGGGPGGATEVMSTFVVKALGTGNIGYALATQMTQVVIITVVALLVNLVLRRREAKLRG